MPSEVKTSSKDGPTAFDGCREVGAGEGDPEQKKLHLCVLLENISI